MAEKSKTELIRLQRKIFDGELGGATNFLAAYFKLEKVKILVDKLNEKGTDFVKVFLLIEELEDKDGNVLKDEHGQVIGHFSLGMAGTNKKRNEANEVVTRNGEPILEEPIFPELTTEGKEEGLIADKPCPPHCQESRENEVKSISISSLNI